MLNCQRKQEKSQGKINFYTDTVTSPQDSHRALKVPDRKDIGPTTTSVFKTFPCKNGLSVPRGEKLVKMVDIDVKVLKLYFFMNIKVIYEQKGNPPFGQTPVGDCISLP